MNQNQTTELIISSENQMNLLGQRLGSALRPGMVLTLNGDLGAGKTTLTKAIAHAMGIKEHITSPTFTIVQEYEGSLSLFHFDAYRIADPEEMYFIGFDEYLAKDGVCIIEWAEKIRDILPESRLDIFIAYEGDNSRKVRLEPQGKDYELLVKQLKKEDLS